jgi:hypothetical protein
LLFQIFFFQNANFHALPNRAPTKGFSIENSANVSLLFFQNFSETFRAFNTFLLQVIIAFIACDFDGPRDLICKQKLFAPQAQVQG